jgi:alpha-galactosidase
MTQSGREAVNGVATIASDRFAVAFDRAAGTLSIVHADGTPFLIGGVACANTGVGKQSTASPGRDRSAGVSAFSDRLGSGWCMTVDCRDPDKRVDLRVDIVVYDRRPIVTIEAHCVNVSSSDVVVESIEPIRVVASEGGTLRVPGVAVCLTNGEMFYDAGRVHAFGSDPPASVRPPVKGVWLANQSVASGRPTIASWWNVGLFSGYDREGVVLGYLENTQALGLVLVARTGEDEISCLGEAVHAPPIVLRPGGSIGSNRFVLGVAATPYAALEQHAEAVGTTQTARTRSIVNGWCSWFYTLDQVSEDEVLRNTAFAAEHLREFGLEYIQVDDGYQRLFGDWQGNERFPHGMQALAERIKAHGFKPGLWIAPYVISEQTELFRQHPDWLLRRRDGSLQRIGNWENESSPAAQAEVVKRYCLDITHPEAAAWLRDLFATIARRWGYEMIKIDFVAWSILAAERYHEPGVSSAEVYRRGLEIMRAAAGDGCHILDCGPANTTVGLIDSMRAEADINYGYAAAAWKQYFEDPACSAAAAAKRYYFHRRTWVTDVDHACLDLLTVEQARAAATLIALSGGNTISGDRLIDLDSAKLEIFKKILPSFGEAAIPVDLLEADIPATFVLRVERPFASWSVVALFNPDLDTAVERRVSLSRLGLDPAKTYLAFDFWRRQLVGEITNDLALKIGPGSVTLLALHAATGAPQLLSTSRHVTQGAIELEDVRWNAGEGALTGVSVGPKRSEHDVFVYVPGDHPWGWGSGPSRVHDHAGYSLWLVDNNVVRVRVRFEELTRVEWHVAEADFPRA